MGGELQFLKKHSEHEDTNTLCTYSGHQVKQNNVCAQMQFSYTFSQRHNTDLLYSHGHHLAPGGNMRRDPDELLALSGERLPRIDRCVTGASGATIRVRQIVGQSGTLLPVKTFLVDNI